MDTQAQEFFSSAGSEVSKLISSGINTIIPRLEIERKCSG
jgi:hypothetical protein